MLRMLTRENLWRRMAGAPAWPMAWAMVPACALPWCIPETWDGAMPRSWLAAGWIVVLASACLFRWKRFAVVPLGLALAWGTLGNLHQRARWETALPRGFVEVEGAIATPWTPIQDGLRSDLEVTAPAALRGARLPLRL